MISAVVLRLRDANSPLTFRGFFIQVVDESGNNVGGFLDPESGSQYRLSSCSPPNVRLLLTNTGGKVVEQRDQYSLPSPPPSRILFS